MSYQVLARKWRPGRFSELVGQEHVVAAIANALDNDRLHHAYLFTGTRGVGKTTIARIFSKSLNCEQGQGSNPCGECATCKEIEHGNYVDLLEIDAASRTKVEDTRELLDNVQYKPTRGRYKVYLIDEVHMLSKHSFNALLKTLEEPPPHVKFLLATTDPQKLPITILSRCLQFNLKALSREQIGQQLQHILQQEQVTFEEAALGLLARAAQGSMRDALSLTDQAIAQGDNQVLKQIVTDMLGLMDKHLLVRLLYAVVQKKSHEVLELVEQMAEQAPDYAQILAELSSLLHQVALTQWVPDACKLETTAAKAIYSLAKQMNGEQVQLFYQIALQGRKDMPFAVDGKSALEMTLLRMMSFAPAAPVADPEKLISESGPETLPGQPSGNETMSSPASEHYRSEAEQETSQPDAEQRQQSTVASADEKDDTDSFLAQQAEAEQAQIEQQARSYREVSTAGSEFADSTPPPQMPETPIPSSSADETPPYQYQEEASHGASSAAAPEQPFHEPPLNEEPVTPSSNSMQEMLALRQKLKRSRQEEAPSEKSLKPTTRLPG
ncbi:DNA polymerase III subunit gamma/tau [Salinimonas marina]|uniref:DNA polymerase III subunit gamma/tau n=1 Tax=Salinimonas marina TaxID=2785918 RepID=UPI0038CD8684